MTPQHPADCDALLEAGRRLASQRDDLIAQGVDPDALEVPLAPHRCPDCSAPRVDGVFGEGPQHPAAPEGETDASGVVVPTRCWYGEQCADTRYCKHPEPTESGGCRPPVAPSTEAKQRSESSLRLTDAEDVLLAEWWVSEGGDHEDLALDSLSTLVERIVAERLRVVEGERDAAMAQLDGRQRWAERNFARAESAEAAHAALVAGVGALAADFDTAVGFRGAATSLRALLAGGGA